MRGLLHSVLSAQTNKRSVEGFVECLVSTTPTVAAAKTEVAPAVTSPRATSTFVEIGAVTGMSHFRQVRGRDQPLALSGVWISPHHRVMANARLDVLCLLQHGCSHVTSCMSPFPPPTPFSRLEYSTIPDAQPNAKFRESCSLRVAVIVILTRPPPVLRRNYSLRNRPTGLSVLLFV